MYLGIDIGGTKTLLAVLDSNGVIKEQDRFPTNRDHNDFLKDLKAAVSKFEQKECIATGVGVAATIIDRDRGVAEKLGNLPWKHIPLQQEIEDICHSPVVIENDAKLAGLSEAMLLKDKYKVVLYITVSTGIGYGLVVKGNIDKNIGDGGGRTMMLEHEDKFVPWEDFASGRAIVERYGHMAKDITDKETWEAISRDLAKGFIELIATTEPEVIVIGGSVGQYFDRYKQPLKDSIAKYHVPLIKMPELVQAQRPDEAVIYGCYDIAKQEYPDAEDN
jgi:predicted NBD/HSP70 family sugar kinase